MTSTEGNARDMKEPLVSVKMITYNHAPLIAQAIEGVLRQKTDFPFEVVIGEDCSTDGTREIVLGYQKRHPGVIRVVTSEANIGMKKNNLRTLRACRGKYIAFCEGDDHWHHPGKLQKQADYLEKNSDCGLVYSNYDVHHVSTGEKIRNFVDYKKWHVPERPTASDIVESRGGRSRAITTCTVMVRRSLCVEIVEADPYLHQNDKFLMGDTQLWAEMAARARLHYLPESLATHNITDESATRSKNKEKVLRFGISGAQLKLYLCDKYNLSPRIRSVYQEYLLDRMLRLALHRRDKRLAEEVRLQKRRFTAAEWLRYYGAGNALIFYLYRVSALLPNLLRKKHDQWV